MTIYCVVRSHERVRDTSLFSLFGSHSPQCSSVDCFGVVIMVVLFESVCLLNEVILLM